ncbi:gp051 [Rhodococcus phage ReqiPepy6]|uniref:Gp051 n=1 Tax=Rhodococcus phage ReqiPepy6 TaxID=691965 RepID=D4P7G2_9CAUD|nr:gp051 [Rhodococcus phage ReqiPepy6]ADD80942.1 gp051 [Rhodococcus phage ReqiPepy6]
MKKLGIVAVSTTVGFAAGVSSVGYIITNKKIMKKVLMAYFKTIDFSMTDEQTRVLGELTQQMKLAKTKKKP